MDFCARHINEVIDRLSGVDAGEARWREACSLVTEIGFSALNIASVQTRTQDMNWVRSSMSESWLTRYTKKGFAEVDPLITNLFRPVRTQIIHAGCLQREHVADDRGFALNHELKQAGYHSVLSYQVKGNRAGEKKLVVLASDQVLDVREAPRFRRLASLFGTMVDTLEGNVFPVIPSGEKPVHLSGREVDVLTMLALGHRNDRIADRLGIAEVTVRAHLLSARRKLGARTREQALVQAVLKGFVCP